MTQIPNLWAVGRSSKNRKLKVTEFLVGIYFPNFEPFPILFMFGLRAVHGVVVLLPYYGQTHLERIAK